MPRDWVISPRWDGREKLAATMGISPIVAQVLHNRQVHDEADARGFLEPRMSDLHPPEALPGARAAAIRIADAVRAGRRIAIYGDYDVDGITAVSILWHCLKLAGATAICYIPHRLEEGYGLNVDALNDLADEGAQLIITVDCGITAIEPARRARERGVELIITDHHEPHRDACGRTILPDALVVHPGIVADGEECYPNRDLSGAGVALKLAWALAQELTGARRVSDEFREFLIDATGLAALGIIADVVPLVGENRILARHGLVGLAKSRLPGLQALIHSAGVTGKSLGGYDIGFKLAPRLNAIGRMGHARLAVEMLTRADAAQAGRIAANLEQQNQARQRLQRRITGEAIELVRREGQDGDGIRGIVLASTDWHAGVIGIVAGRVAEEFGRPTVMIALENGVGQGSARSIRHFALNEVLADCSAHLLSYGGHAMAAGLRIEAARVDDFRAAFQNRAAQLLTPADLRPRLSIDDEIDLSDLSPRLVYDFSRLEPFGAGNPAPRLATKWLDLVGEPRLVGNGESHLQLMLGDGSCRCKGIAFGQGRMRDALCNKRRCRVAFEPIINEWQGRTSVEMQIVDFQFPD